MLHVDDNRVETAALTGRAPLLVGTGAKNYQRCELDGQDFGVEEWHGRVAVVRATGAVDMVTAPLLEGAIRTAREKMPTGLIVDLSDAEFLSSAGMHVLVTAHEDITPRAQFAVVAEGPGTSRPLKITGLTDFIDLFSTLDAALNSFAE